MMTVIKKSIPYLLIITFFSTTSFGFLEKAEAQQYVPVHDSQLQEALLQELGDFHAVAEEKLNYTANATAALAKKEVGDLSGLVSPQVSGTVNAGNAISLANSSLDGYYIALLKPLIQAFTQSIVGWIDSGFSGQPTFVNDPEGFLIGVADSVAGDFIDGTELGFLCEPFELEVRAILNYNYSSPTYAPTCTLTDILGNIENFTDFTSNGNFTAGGWDGWFATVHPDGNIYGSYLAAEAELGVRIKGRSNIELLQLDWGSGFLSWQECQDPPGAPLSECVTKGPIQTPGTIIETGLSDTLGSDLRQWELADEFDKIINALINQLVSSAMNEFLGG